MPRVLEVEEGGEDSLAAVDDDEGGGCDTMTIVCPQVRHINVACASATFPK